MKVAIKKTFSFTLIKLILFLKRNKYAFEDFKQYIFILSNFVFIKL